MNLADPALELLDPTPNVHVLFLTFDKLFFWTQLANKAVVRWCKKMYSNAGLCSYYGRGGLCDISLSEPLLKLRPRKDLVETLLHEMIHAYLFITCQDRERDGHGPSFQAHMHRINISAGLNISIYHDFLEEVESYQTHWWRCNGPCQTMQPAYGIVRRAINSAPGPRDSWWPTHQMTCGGTFVKIKEPPKKTNKGKVLLNTNKINNSDQNKKPTKHEADPDHSDSPPPKIKKIDEYFKNTAPSLLKALYGQDIKITQENDKIIAVPNRDLVDCPICNQKVESIEINKHLDECLNKDIIKQLSKDSSETISQGTSSDSTDRQSPKDIVGSLPHIPAFKKKDINDNNKMFREENGDIKPTTANETVDLTHINVNFTTNGDIKPTTANETVDLTHINVNITSNSNITPTTANETVDLTHINVNFTTKVQNPIIKEENIQFVSSDVNRVKAVVKRINYDKNIRKSDNFIVPKQGENEIGHSFLDDMRTVIKAPKIKIEPGTSKDIVSSLTEQKCPCCGKVLDKPMVEHLDECLSFFDNNTIVIDNDDDDILDETMTMNATGTKTPCPCCMKMVEMSDMNNHLDCCLS